MQKKYTTEEQIEQMKRELQLRKQNQKPMPHGKGVSRIVFGSIVVLLLSALICVQIQRSRGEIPNLFGFQIFRIESGSMEPTLRIGSVILTRKADAADTLRKGDVVTFRTLTGFIVTHRIIEVLNNEASVSYRTKGDNPLNSADPDLLTPDRILSVFVLKIPLT